MADYGLLQDHADIVLALLYGQAGITTYPAVNGGPATVPPGTAPPYRSVHVVADRAVGDNLPAKSTRFRMRIYVHHVAANDTAAQYLSDQTADVLTDAKVLIAGRECFPIRQEPSRDPYTTEPVAPTTVTITDVYRLESEPGRDGS